MAYKIQTDRYNFHCNACQMTTIVTTYIYIYNFLFFHLGSTDILIKFDLFVFVLRMTNRPWLPFASSEAMKNIFGDFHLFHLLYIVN